MTLKSLKQSLHSLIDNIHDEELLAAYYKIIVSGQQSDWWENIKEGEKKAITSGLADIEEGKVYSHEDVMKEVNLLLNRKK